MNFIPTKEMKYANALRNYLQKRGANAKQILSLHLYEAVFCKSAYEITVNIEDITDTLFGALYLLASAKGINLKTQKGRGKKVKINVKLYEFLLSSIAFSAEEILIKANFSEHFICVFFYGKPKKDFYKRIAALMGGVCLNDIKTGKNAVFIPVIKGEEKIEKYKSEIELIRDKNGVINLLSKIL